MTIPLFETGTARFEPIHSMLTAHTLYPLSYSLLQTADSIFRHNRGIPELFCTRNPAGDCWIPFTGSQHFLHRFFKTELSFAKR